MGELRFIAHARARQAARERLDAASERARADPRRDRGQQGAPVDQQREEPGTTA